MQAQATGARLPARAGPVAPQSGELVPRLRAVGRAESRVVSHAGVDGLRIAQRRLEVPDPLELPRMRRAVVPLVRTGDAVVGELVADRLPRRSAVVGALHDLTEPAARLRRVDPIRVGRRAFQVIDLPAGEMRARALPVLAASLGLQDEGAFSSSPQQPASAHTTLPPRRG